MAFETQNRYYLASVLDLLITGEGLAYKRQMHPWWFMPVWLFHLLAKNFVSSLAALHKKLLEIGGH